MSVPQNVNSAAQQGFSITVYAVQAFVVWQDPVRYGEGGWRFVPDAAYPFTGLRFHLRQVLEQQGDDGLICRFHAAGWLEMAGDLYQWGEKVAMLAPPAPRDSLILTWRLHLVGASRARN